jgi:16S rRNA processing protein RimM
MESDELVLVGEVTAPFGMRGEVKLLVYLDDPTTLIGRTFLLNSGQPGRVQSLRKHQDQVLILFEGVDRSAAEALRGTRLFLPKSELPPLPEGAYYDWQLKGLAVVTESGRALGAIETIFYNPVANDVYETSLALIPAHPQFVLSVDLEAGRMVVSDDPGLLK